MRPSRPAGLFPRPIIQFRPSPSPGRRPNLGLARTTAVYHRPLRDRRTTPTVHALRCQTSRFRFPDVGRLAAHRARRPSLPLGLPRARRA